MLFSAVSEAASNDKGCPQMKYTAYSFYSNTKRNSWKMHFNVTKMLNVLSKVRLCALSLLYCLQANFTRSKSMTSIQMLKWGLTFRFNFVTIESL